MHFRTRATQFLVASDYSHNERVRCLAGGLDRRKHKTGSQSNDCNYYECLN